MSSTVKIALVDDHALLRSALARLINTFDDCEVVIQANNGREYINQLPKLKGAPDVVLLDLNMPEMNGYDTADWINKNQPDTKTLMVTMYDSEHILIKLLQYGVKGFLKKDVDPSELKYAINSVMNSGFYYSSHTAGKMANIFRNSTRENPRFGQSALTDQDITFLRHACSDLTYKEIAHAMKLSPRTIDAIRDHLFIQMDVKSRVGLVMMAIRNGLVNCF